MVLVMSESNGTLVLASLLSTAVPLLDLYVRAAPVDPCSTWSGQQVVVAAMSTSTADGEEVVL